MTELSQSLNECPFTDVHKAIDEKRRAVGCRNCYYWGDASVRKVGDTCLTSGASSPATYRPEDMGRCYSDAKFKEAAAQVFSSEITDIDWEPLRLLLGRWSVQHHIGLKNDDGMVLLELLRPYLRTNKPVSVSLEKCALAGFDAYKDYEGVQLWPKVAKAVLDAAGVAYVE